MPSEKLFAKVMKLVLDGHKEVAKRQQEIRRDIQRIEKEIDEGAYPRPKKRFKL